MKRYVVSVGVIGVVLIIMYEIFSYVIVKKNVNEQISQINKGKEIWNEMEQVKIAENIENILENKDRNIINYIIQNAEIKYKISVPIGEKCRVSYNITNIKFDNFMEYCNKNSVDIEGIEQAFYKYLNSKYEIMECNVDIYYELKNGYWVADYCDYNFMDAVTGGLCKVYQEYYKDMINNIQTFIRRDRG